MKIQQLKTDNINNIPLINSYLSATGIKKKCLEIILIDRNVLVTLPNWNG